ncbi:MAG: hypothetical protein NC906_06090 [Candidatus Omnitrophica bacterium]|nr:hypothetical protein [Candidatus Omnitrophota bacterium]MCM8816360.1 hypothetical protein [Candidatus Omnitrophota bacterium]
MGPIFFILVITVVAAEALWLWFIYPHDQELSMPVFLFLEFAVLTCLVLSFLSFAGRFDREFIFVSPFIPPVLYIGMKRIFQLREKKYENEKIKREIEGIMKSSGITGSTESFEKIGDIYFSRQDFDKALSWFRKAQSIKDTPEITHKINLAKKEILLKQNKIWVCPECSITNPSTIRKCKSCGTLKPSIETLKDEIRRNAGELKKNLINIVILVVMISLFIWFVKSAAFLTSLIFFGIIFLFFMLFILYKIFSR